MKSIKDIIAILQKEDSNSFRAFNILQEGIEACEKRLSQLEAKNLKYYSRAILTADVTLTTGVSAVVNFDGTDYPQYDNLHSNTNNPDKIYIRRGGVYVVSASATFQANATGYRELDIYRTRSGVNTIIGHKRQAAIAAVDLPLGLATCIHLMRGDYLWARVLQTSGGNLDLLAYDTSIHRTYLAVMERMEDLDVSELGLQPVIERF